MPSSRSHLVERRRTFERLRVIARRELFELAGVDGHRLCREGDTVPFEQHRVKRKRMADGEQCLSQTVPCLLHGSVVPEECRQFVPQVSVLQMHGQIRQQHLGFFPWNRRRDARIGSGLEPPKKRQLQLRHVGGKIALSRAFHHSQRVKPAVSVTQR